ncbi:hypothetical protein B0H15DRAFT_940776 [Mycena belliarum]|uniref:NmrA-like domain-containing protein n=1 Tax=Mycena belliarum TaxID=1033014 RepID=A0AAD6TV94_9AGAR|nr:hypothetical protein B0H15DRAFT_940776 [Mycena belliae]
MVKQRVLLLGATGETGGSILNGLLEDTDSFDVEALVRPASTGKPQVQELSKRGVKIRSFDIGGSVDDVAKSLTGVDVLISAIDAMSQLAQLNLVTAAKQAGVKRFVPCGFITVVPPGGVMLLRDNKEEVYQLVRKLHLPYTIIDVGYWYQISFPGLPSGRVDYALVKPLDEIHAEGTAPNMLTDLRDVGRFVALIIKDPRSMNKYVACYGDVLSENEIFKIAEEMSGEVISRKYVPASEITATRDQYASAFKASPGDFMAQFMVTIQDYLYSKYVRGDNTPAYAAYLGYLDAKELYPDFRPRSFKDFMGDLLDGKAAKPYPHLGDWRDFAASKAE